MKHNVSKKLLCLILISALLFLTSCGGGGADESTDTSKDEASEIVAAENGAEWITKLDDAGGKYRDKSINVISVSKDLFYGEGQNPVSKAVTNRNGLVERYLGMSVACTEKKAEEIYSELKAAYDAGLPYADLICAPVSVLSRLASEGLLENLYSLPYLDLDAAYAYSKGIERQRVGNTLYFYSGAFTNSANSNVGIFFNKALVSAVGADPVRLAKNGVLTWGALTSMVQSVAENGADGIASLLDDGTLATAIYGSSGNGLLISGDGGLECVYDATTAFNTASIIEGLFDNSEYAVKYGRNEAAEAFKSGRLGFVVATLDCVSLFDGAESEWGLIPLPKITDLQEQYSSFVSGSALAFAVPRGCTDSGFSGFALNALLAASAGTMEDALKTTYINYYFWSNDAAVMLNTICRTAKFDIGVMYSAVPEAANAGVAKIAAGGELGDEEKDSLKAFADRMFH